MASDCFACPTLSRAGSKVLLELFGSSFMRSNNVVIALLLGYLIAAVSKHEGNNYVVNDKIKDGEYLKSFWTQLSPSSSESWLLRSTGHLSGNKRPRHAHASRGRPARVNEQRV